jgi:hypothetical protein
MTTIIGGWGVDHHTRSGKGWGMFRLSGFGVEKFTPPPGTAAVAAKGGGA